MRTSPERPELRHIGDEGAQSKRRVGLRNVSPVHMMLFHREYCIVPSVSVKHCL